MIKVYPSARLGLVCLSLTAILGAAIAQTPQPKVAAPIEPTPSEPPALNAPLPVPPALLPQFVPQPAGNPFAHPVANPFAPAAANPFALVSTPSGSTAFARLVSLPKISEQQIRELILDAITVLEVTQSYKRVREDAAKDLPLVPDKIQLFGIAQRVVGNKKDFVRLGVLQHPRRLPQLWIEGRTLVDGATVANPDADKSVFDPLLTNLLQERNKIMDKLALSELEARVITLSYVEADTALFTLRAMGYAAITDEESVSKDDSYKGLDVALLQGNAANAFAPGNLPGAPPATPSFGAPPAFGSAPSFGSTPSFGSPSSFGSAPSFGGSSFGSTSQQQQPNSQRYASAKNFPTSIAFDRLPLIYKIPDPDAKNSGLAGADYGATGGQGAGGRDQLGLTALPGAASQLQATVAATTTQLLVLTHPQYPEQFAKLKRVIEETIDRPARQIFIDSMILEVSSDALRDLGVKWDLKKGTEAYSLGALSALPLGGSALSAIYDAGKAVSPRQMLAQINALIETNQAEVLARPSVMTLDNRQATIRVGTDIPVATSKDAGTGSGGGRVAFSFQYIPTGAILNVRPRIGADGKEISMLIDATISAPVPGADLKVLDPVTNVALASAPTLSQRRVQTYSRIRDAQPLIIGGLISREQVTRTDKIPLLGDIPFLKKLAGYEGTKTSKREVIIVLTPTIVTEEFRATKWQLPRDDDRFDLFGTSLFRESYRIRAEDLVDSQYIRFSQRLLAYRRLANQAIANQPSLANKMPFSRFVGTKVPGELIFVSGMMSRMLTRLNGAQSINIDKLMFFEGNVRGPSFKMQSVGDALRRHGGGSDAESFFSKNPGRALALTFKASRASLDAADMNTEPVAEVSVIPCANRTEWRRLMWELNHPGADGTPRYTMLIHQPEDITGVKLAVALKNTILANGNEANTIFDNFLPGRVLNLQEASPNWERVIEANVARNFFWDDFYMPAFNEELDRAINDLDRALRVPDVASGLDLSGLPVVK